MSYPQGPGQQGENPYPQYQQPQYQEPQYPPTPAYPPQYQQPGYGQPPMPAQYAAPAAPVKEKNPYGGQALIIGIVSFVVSVVAFFLGYYVVGVLGLYAIYASIRGLIVAARLRTHAGLAPSIIGLVFSILSLLVTLVALGVFDSILIPLLGGGQ